MIAEENATSTPTTKGSTVHESKKVSTTPTSANTSTEPGRRGRPKGSKNKPKVAESKKSHLYQSKASEQDRLLAKFDGPFVRVQGDINKPDWSGFVNSSIDPISPVASGKGKYGGKPGINDRDHIKRAESFGPTSTLSSEYDSKKFDESWLCVYCKKPSHYHGLGDLFGPYFISSDVRKSSSKKQDKELASKFILGGDSSKKKKKRRSSESMKEQSEIWFHEDCICWLPEISLIGSRLLGLEESVMAADKAMCCKCKIFGATIACIYSSCKLSAHYICAQEGKWYVNEDDFEAFCYNHKPSGLKSP